METRPPAGLKPTLSVCERILTGPVWVRCPPLIGPVSLVLNSDWPSEGQARNLRPIKKSHARKRWPLASVRRVENVGEGHSPAAGKEKDATLPKQ